MPVPTPGSQQGHLLVELRVRNPRKALMAQAHDTAMDLLHESADALEAVANACDESEDASRLLALTDRIRRYLATSRSTTTLGMPRITSSGNELSETMVVRRTEAGQYGHVRIVPE